MPILKNFLKCRNKEKKKKHANEYVINFIIYYFVIVSSLSYKFMNNYKLYYMSSFLMDRNYFL